MARAKVFGLDQNIDIDELLEYCRDIRSKRMKNKCSRYICEILLNIDSEPDRADNLIKRIIEADKQDNFRFLLGQDYLLYAELHRRHGNPSESRQHLTKAVEIFKDCGATGWAEKYK